MAAIRDFARRRPVLTFFTLAYLLGWLLILPLVLSPAGLGLIKTEVPQEILMLFATAPTIAALWTQWLSQGNFRICGLGPSWPRVVLATVAGGLLVLVTFSVLPALLLTRGAVRTLSWSALVGGSLAWWSNPFNLLGGPLNEEPGWRGFALPRLQARYGPLAASVLLGLVWAAWHLPLWVVGIEGIPIWAFVMVMVCNSGLMTWAMNRSGGSILPPMLMHAGYNSSFAIMAGLCQGNQTREPGLPIYLAGAVLATVVVVAVTRGRLGSRPKAG